MKHNELPPADLLLLCWKCGRNDCKSCMMANQYVKEPGRPSLYDSEIVKKYIRNGLSAEQVSEMVGVNKRTVYRWYKKAKQEM